MKRSRNSDSKRLRLASETLRRLDDSELRIVGGASGQPGSVCACTFTAPSGAYKSCGCAPTVDCPE